MLHANGCRPDLASTSPRTSGSTTTRPGARRAEITRVSIDAQGTGDLVHTLRSAAARPAWSRGWPAIRRKRACRSAPTPVGESETVFRDRMVRARKPAEAGPIRWMGEHGAVLLSSRERQPAFTSACAPRPPCRRAVDDATILTLRVNDVFDAAADAMHAGSRTTSGTCPTPPGCAGTNELSSVCRAR